MNGANNHTAKNTNVVEIAGKSNLNPKTDQLFLERMTRYPIRKRTPATRMIPDQKPVLNITSTTLHELRLIANTGNMIQNLCFMTLVFFKKIELGGFCTDI